SRKNGAAAQAALRKGRQDRRQERAGVQGSGATFFQEQSQRPGRVNRRAAANALERAQGPSEPELEIAKCPRLRRRPGGSEGNLAARVAPALSHRDNVERRQAASAAESEARTGTEGDDPARGTGDREGEAHAGAVRRRRGLRAAGTGERRRSGRF